MATGRMLKKQISLNEAVNDLSLKAALLFTWCIPHADDFGRMPGSPRRIKAEVMPLRDDFSQDDVTECLQALQDAGLICWYEVGGERYVAFPTWDEHQSGLHKRTKSRFPPPPGSSGTPPIRAPEVPGNSGKFRTNGTEQNGTEGNGTEPLPDIASTIQGEDAPATEGQQLWAAAVDRIAGQTTPGAVEVIRACRVFQFTGDMISLAAPSDAAIERVERHHVMMRQALRQLAGREVGYYFVNPNSEARAGPEVSTDAHGAAGP